ncbi:MAG: hypothetical protein CL554_05870 [Algoriphagus sp.]|uniref:VCBS repeat-containing protein n=1 Tax=Algoriphagus sp. TaxID=1872435 RepID=UPI000C5F3724|nr:VCBS repeat-containing protein [Algoriphagus sp.]MAL12940.1 hypothetical protein [Algoriphagus sp.]
MTITKFWRFTGCILAITLLSCKKEEKKEKLFELLSAQETGIDFQNNLTSSPEINILEYLYFYNGGGVAAGDINNDGLVDLVFTGNQVPNRLFLNKGNFQFEDITESSGIYEEGSWSNGATFADINGDGLLDLYISQVGDYKGIQGKNKLYINQGDLTFIELGEQYGVDFKGFGTHAVFFDYDRDGDLDLYLLNHGVKSPEVFAKSENRVIADEGGDKLLKNLASEGQRGFIDVTEEAGIYSSVLGFGLGVSIEDFNQDGWLDIYVSNDFTENDYLYINQQDGTFLESLQSIISNTSRYSMGNDAADIDGDGYPDIFTTDMLPEDPEIWMKSVGEDKAEVYSIKKQFNYGDQYVRNHLQLNTGKGEFSEVALYAEVFASVWSWSPLIFDMDNDGLMDIHVTNGIVKRPNDLDFIQYSQEADPNLKMDELRKRQIEMLPSVQLPNYTFHNQGNLKFKAKAKEFGLDQASYSNGSTYADLDNDGDLDLIVNNLNQPAFIYRNKSESLGHNYVSVELKSAGNNPFAIGAEVKVITPEKKYRQLLSTSRGFQSGTSTNLIFGLGKVDKIDAIQVRWPDGTFEQFEGLSINQKHLLIKGGGKEFIPEGRISEAANSDFSISWYHQEKNELDETKREYLIPRSFAAEGPASASADINGDGLTDIFLGGAKDQAGAFFLQKEDGGFEPIESKSFSQLAKAEDVVAAFEDFNGDGYLDLYVGSGGNEYEADNLFLFDRILYGNGKGNFAFFPNALPPIGQNTSSLAIHDVNGDGFPDIFVGASVLTGDYGASPYSYLLINNGRGQFRDQTQEWFGAGKDLGMIQDATWSDLDGDGAKELILSGDWQAIRVFKNKGNKLDEIFSGGLEKSTGWVNEIMVEDINGDGLKDILVGNLGLNSKLKASHEKPVVFYHHDFDGNGQADPLIFHYMGEKLVPFATRDDLIKQIPGVKRMHSSYQEYAKISKPEDLFGKDIIGKLSPKYAYEFRSGVYFQKEDGTFEFEAFPWQAQLSPIKDMKWNAATQTLWIVGNDSGFRVDLGKNTSSSNLKLQWTKEGWKVIKEENKVPSQAELRRIEQIKSLSNSYIIGISNNGPVYFLGNSEN